MRVTLITLFPALLSLAAQPQVNDGRARNNVSPIFAAGPGSNAVVTGAPYSAEGQSQNVRTLADGTHISSPHRSWKFYRDSKGRARVERPVTPPDVVIEITDPVAQLKYTLDPANKVAHREHWTAPAGAPGFMPMTNLFPSRQGGENQPVESLGNKEIEGIACEGSRLTTIWPVGSIGNDRALTTEREIWRSTELDLTILYKSSDPQMGESTQKLINISRAEPAADHFQPPKDYTVEDYPTDQQTSATPYRIGKDVSAPNLIWKVEPSYSEEALKAKLSGSAMLSLVVGTDGIPRDIKVVRPLGMGLDEKAVEAVSRWRFKPGMKDGVAVPVKAQVQVNFQLATNPF